MNIVTEQERADWVNPWPEDGEQCPDCRQGQLEVQQFGQGVGLELHAWCGGLNGISQDDADEDEAEQAGCGWSGRQRAVGYVRGNAMCRTRSS